MRILQVSAVFAVSACWGVANVALAFGEEPVGANVEGVSTSSHHFNLTRALATCAGFPHSSEEDWEAAPMAAERLALFDALVDGERFGKYTNCTASSYDLPSSALEVDPAAGGLSCIGDSSELAFPLVGDDKKKEGEEAWDPTCFTSRFGPYSSLFHFPTEAELASLRAWAFGKSSSVSGRAVFVFGGSHATLWSPGACFVIREEVVDTGDIEAGSIEALGVYLHALGDWFSHSVCEENWGTTENPPWYTHTIPDEPFGCAFFAHTYEFGCPTQERVPFIENSVEAARRIYEELLAWGAEHDFEPKIDDFAAHDGWLRRQVERYAVLYDYGEGGRVPFTYDLLLACEELSSDVSGCLPDIESESATDCETYASTPLCTVAPNDAGIAPDSGLVQDSGASSAPDAAETKPTKASSGCDCRVTEGSTGSPRSRVASAVAFVLAGFAFRARRARRKRKITSKCVRS